MKASIQPVNLLGKTATVLDVINANVRLGYFANLNYVLMNAAGESLFHGDLTMPSDDYALWGADDAYVLQYVAQKLNLTVIEVITDPAPTAA